MDLSTTTRTVSESYNDGLAAYHSGAFQFNAVIAVLNIHMEHLFEEPSVQHLLRGAGVDFLTGVDSNDPVTVLECLLKIVENHDDGLALCFQILQ